MVGESFYFTREYNPHSIMDSHANQCRVCKKFADKVVFDPRNPDMPYAEQRFKNIIKYFCNHLEKDHGVEFLVT